MVVLTKGVVPHGRDLHRVIENVRGRDHSQGSDRQGGRGRGVVLRHIVGGDAGRVSDRVVLGRRQRDQC